MNDRQSLSVGGRYASRLRTWATGLTGHFNALFEGEQALDIVGVMTLITSIAHLQSTPQLREVVQLFAIAGILDRRLLRQAPFWLALTGAFVVNHVLLWHTLDNHKWLLTYWCLALGVSRLSSDTMRAAALNGRLLIGLCFVFATAAKLLSSEYLDGSFFEFVLLIDVRFSGFSDLVGGVPAETMNANIAAMLDLSRPYGNVDTAYLQGAARIDNLALFMTWWTVAIEGTIGVLFLLPARLRIVRVRDLFLLLFMFSTYPVATVVGFGRVLAAMGLIQSPNRTGFERPAYLLAFIFLPVYKFPFVRAVRWLLG